MELQEIIIDGHKATLAYFDAKLEMVEEEHAAFAKVVFEDGTNMFYAVQPKEPATLGGKGSGDFGHAGRKGEVGGSGSGADRAERAKASYKPSTREKQQLGAKSVTVLAKIVGGEVTDDNLPMDVVIKEGKKTVGVEVKTLIDNKNDKITMHPESLARKVAWIKANKAVGHTVVVDRRGSSPVYYHREGFGSFRVGTLDRVSPSELKSRLKG